MEHFIFRAMKELIKTTICFIGQLQGWKQGSLQSAEILLATQPIFICSNLTIETSEQDMKYLQS